jgi:hypothetical protein
MLLHKSLAGSKPRTPFDMRMFSIQQRNAQYLFLSVWFLSNLARATLPVPQDDSPALKKELVSPNSFRTSSLNPVFRLSLTTGSEHSSKCGSAAAFLPLDSQIKTVDWQEDSFVSFLSVRHRSARFSRPYTGETLRPVLPKKSSLIRLTSRSDFVCHPLSFSSSPRVPRLFSLKLLPLKSRQLVVIHPVLTHEPRLHSFILSFRGFEALVVTFS